MPIKDLFWTRGKTDFHLLKGQSSLDLSRHKLYVEETTNLGVGTSLHTYKNANPGISVDFKPLFKHVVNGNFYEGQNLKVNKSTGVVTFIDITQAITKHNFILEITITEGANTFNEKLRFHVHTSVQSAWLTPETLSIRQGIDNYKFDLYVKFDDDVVGNITDFTGISWRSKNTAVVTIDDSNSFDTDGRITVVNGTAAGTNVQIEATLPADLGGSKIEATVKAFSALPASHPVELVDSSVGPGIAKIDEAINVLFLCDGFLNTAADKDKFDEYCCQAVKEMTTSSLLEPFRTLRNSFNFWKAFVPSEQKGANVLNYIVPKNKSGSKFDAEQVPTPRKPEAGVIKYDINNVMYLCGTPVKSQASLTVAQIKTYWKNTLHPDPTPKIDNDVIEKWKSYATLTLVNQQNTAFGLHFGSKTTAYGEFSPPRTIGLYNNRTNRANLNKFLDTLTYTDPGGVNHNIGNRWSVTGTTLNQDYDNVIFFTALRYGGGRTPNSDINRTDYINIDVIESSKFKIQSNGLNQFNIVDIVMPNKLAVEQKSVFAHEFTHSLMLDDEYGNQLNFPDRNINDSRQKPNLIAEKDIVSGGSFDGSKIKWRWFRIKKASIIDTIAIAGNVITLTLQDGFKTFKSGEHIFLRKREIRKPIMATQQSSDELVFVSQVGKTLKLNPKAGSTIPTAADFPKHSIVFTAKPSSANDQARDANYKFEELISLSVRKYIDTKNKPLTKSVCAIDDNDIQNPIIPSAKLPSGFTASPQLIGLYAGGDGYHCKIFHPSGASLMRGMFKGKKIIPLCAVSKYAIVDRIDPNKHGDIDKLYDDCNYPK